MGWQAWAKSLEGNHTSGKLWEERNFPLPWNKVYSHFGIKVKTNICIKIKWKIKVREIVWPIYDPLWPDYDLLMTRSERYNQWSKTKFPTSLHKNDAQNIWPFFGPFMTGQITKCYYLQQSGNLFDPLWPALTRLWPVNDPVRTL